MDRLFFLVRLFSKMNERVGRSVSWVMLPMLFVMLYEVFTRYVISAPTEWGTETSSFLFAAYTLLGAGYALLYGDHVIVNVLYNRFPTRKKALVDLITSVFFFLYCGVLIKGGTIYLLESIQMGRTSGTDWNPPLWPALIALPVGTLLMLLQGVAKFIKDLNIVYTGKEPQA